MVRRIHFISFIYFDKLQMMLHVYSHGNKIIVDIVWCERDFLPFSADKCGRGDILK